jgi:O-antigen ligase
MIGNLLIIIALITISIFFGLMLFSTKNKNQLYIQFILLLFPFLGIDLFPSWISVTIFDFCTMVFVALFYKNNNQKYTENRIYMTLLMILTIITILGSLNSEYFTRENSSSLIQLLTIFIFAKIIIDETISDTNFINKILDSIRVTLIFSLIFLIAQFIFGPAFSIAKTQNINVDGIAGIRYPSFFQDPQKYAQFLSATSFLLLIKKNNDAKLSTLNIILFVMSIAALMFTGGRAAFGGWIVGLIILMIIGNKKYRSSMVLACLLLIPGIVIFADQIPMFKRASVSDSFDFRYLIWQDAYKIFLDNPILGIGTGNYSNYVAVHNPDQFWIAYNEITIFDHPESGYLKLLTEYGAFGFTTIIGLIIYPIISGFIKYREKSNITILIYIAAIATWLIGFYTVYSFGDVRIKVLIVTIVCMLIANQSKIKVVENK